MRQKTLIATVALLALAALVAMPVAGLAVTDAQETNQTNETTANDTVDEQTVNDTEANETALGERLTGIVGVQEAELEGDIEQRTFGIQVAQASTEQAPGIVGDKLGDIEQRLMELEEQKVHLEEERAAGNVTEGQYRAEVAKIATQTETVSQLANQSEHVASQFPADIDVDAIQTLKANAANLSGGEVADIAKDIAGPNVGDVPTERPPIEIPDQPEDRAGPDADDDEWGDQPDADEDERGNQSDSDDRPGADDQPGNGSEHGP